MPAPLHALAEENMDAMKQAKSKAAGRYSKASKGVVILYLDDRVPFSTTRSVMYTLGQAQYSTFLFAVDDVSLVSTP